MGTDYNAVQNGNKVGDNLMNIYFSKEQLANDYPDVCAPASERVPRS